MSITTYRKCFQEDEIFKRFVIVCENCRNKMVIDLQVLYEKFEQQRFYPVVNIKNNNKTTHTNSLFAKEKRYMVLNHLFVELRVTDNFLRVPCECGKCRAYKYDVLSCRTLHEEEESRE